MTKVKIYLKNKWRPITLKLNIDQEDRFFNNLDSLVYDYENTTDCLVSLYPLIVRYSDVKRIEVMEKSNG